MGRKKHRKSSTASHGLAPSGSYSDDLPRQLPLIQINPSQSNLNQSMSNKKNVKQVKQSPGLMTCIFEHAVESTTANFEWEGPKMNIPNRDWWNEVMAFFEWTQREHRSEAQVRVFVNPTTREWKGWAFPQKGKTGMTTKELPDHEQTAVQRAQFGDDWVYYCTIHHHCSSSAFQSGTDTQNEIGQDGLHITIGKVGSLHYDIHARVYQSRYELPHIKLNTFWDVTQIKSTIPEHLKSVMPEDVDLRLAMFEMCVPPPPETTFPEIWKENYIIEAPAARPISTVNHYFRRGVNGVTTNFIDRSKQTTKWDIDRCAADIKSMLKESGNVGAPVVTLKRMLDVAGFLNTFQDEDLIIMDLMFKHDMAPDDFVKQVEEICTEDLEKELNKPDQGTPAAVIKEVGLPSEKTKQDEMEYEGGHYHGYGAGYGMGG